MEKGQEENQDNTTRTRVYDLLTRLRSACIRDYHILTRTYLTANSILITAIAILIAQNYTFRYYVSLILSLAGVLLCVQMYIAQGISLGERHYLERKLRITEKNWKDGPKIFLELHDFKENGKKLPGEVGEPPLVPGFSIKYQEKWWARRMKLLPWIFGLIFTLLFVWSLYNAVKLL